MKAKRNRSSSKGLFLAAAMGMAALLMLLLVVAFIKPESSPDNPDSSTEPVQSTEDLQDKGEAGSRDTDSDGEIKASSEDGSSAADEGFGSDETAETSDTSESGSANAGTEANTVSGIPQESASMTQQWAVGTPQGAGNAVLPGSQQQVAYDSQLPGGYQQLPAGQSQPDGSNLLPGTTQQPAVGTALPSNSDIIPGTILPADGSQGNTYQSGTSDPAYTGQPDSQYSQSAPTAILLSPDNYELVVATAYVNIRNLPSLDALILSVLAEGGAILRDDNTNGWSRVYYNGRTAYIYSQYLIPIR